MSPKQLRELLAELKTAIPGINSIIPVVDDSQLATKIENKSTADNIILVGVLPQYGRSGSNADRSKRDMAGMLLIVEKTDYSDFTDEAFIELYERTFLVADAVEKYLLTKASEGCYNLLSFLDVNSLIIRPVWKKAGCNGYSLEFDTL